MATTLMPVDPAVSPQRVNRLLTISANLLPEEVIAGRRARRTRTWVIGIVVLVALLCGGWIAYADHQRQEADRELTAVTSDVVSLQRDQRGYASVVQLRIEADELKGQLQTVMANDLDWAALLKMLRGTGPAGIEVSDVSGKIAAAADGGGATTSAGSLPSTSTSSSIGTVTVTGSAPDKEAVAAYVDALGRQTTIANPYVTSVTKNTEEVAGANGNGVTFSINVDITSKALCGRFGTACPSTGGK